MERKRAANGNPSRISADVVVIGAGVAGLACARAVAHAGRRVVLVESRERVGGRILTLRDPGCELPVELGAEFIHGKPPELWDLVEEAGLSTFELDGTNVSYEKGRLQTDESEESFDLLRHLEPDTDVTLAAFLRQQHLPPDEAEWATAYVEGFNAADASRIGTKALYRQQVAEDAIEGDRLFRIVEGYDRFPEFLLKRFLAAGGRLLSETIVHTVEWQPNRVQVFARAAESFVIEAGRAVIALPLGVLQADIVRFDPMPQRIFEAAHRMAMGHAKRLALVFSDPFWRSLPGLKDLSFLFSLKGTPPTWWTTAPRHTPILTGWIGGPKADAAPDGEELVKEGLAALSRFLGREHSEVRGKLRSWRMHDWQNDEFSRGAYSYAPQGAADASAAMAEPVEATLFFAGEHTDTTGHWGTVHGALRSGLRAAKQLAEGWRE